MTGQSRKYLLQSGWSVFVSSKRPVAGDVFIFLRISPAQFIVPFEQYMGSIKGNYSIGMRFKMRFEGEESLEQRFTGTLIAIDDADLKRGRESKWRCLKIRWDGTSVIQSPDRVSPWQIELAMTPPMINSLPVPGAKRPCPSVVTPSTDSSVLTREGRLKWCEESSAFSLWSPGA